MPYIKMSERRRYYNGLIDLAQGMFEGGWSVGHLTYILYRLVMSFWHRDQSYKTICDIRGVLIGTLAEFDRRVAGPYEQAKIDQNGDI
jgi:hypothetical protein